MTLSTSTQYYALQRIVRHSTLCITGTSAALYSVLRDSVILVIVRYCSVVLLCLSTLSLISITECTVSDKSCGALDNYVGDRRGVTQHSRLRTTVYSTVLNTPHYRH